VKGATDALSAKGPDGIILNRGYGMMMSLSFLGAILSQVYVPLPDIQVYFVECAFFASLVLVDAIDRKAGLGTTLLYFLSSLILAPLAVPRWYANRPLKCNECRKGGVHTNFLNAFAILTVVFTGVSAACNFLSFGPDRGFELIINSGFCVAGTALVLGLIVRQESVLEKGAKPTLSEKVESEPE
jgi:hypothetical protein